MKKNLTTKYLWQGAGCLFLFILLACTSTEYPEPSEDPIHLTSEAQTKYTRVKNLYGIGAENPETDKIYVDNNQTATRFPEIIIENDWIRITEGGVMPMDKLEIVVKENTLPQPRSYNLTINSHIQTSRLTIVQAGKSQ